MALQGVDVLWILAFVLEGFTILCVHDAHRPIG